MNLKERYVTAVVRRLPPAQRADVRAELAAAIEDALESRGGSAADEDTVVEVLTSLGNPDTVAAMYHPAGQYLIGPELYPSFRRIAAIVLGGLLAVVVGSFVVTLFTEGMGPDLADRLLDWIGFGIRAALGALGLLVVVYAVVQRYAVKPPAVSKAWDPRDLPDIREADFVGRFEAVAGLVVAAFAMVIVSDVATSLRDDAPPALRPVVETVLIDNLLLLNVCLLLFALLYVLLLVQGGWRPATRVLRVLADLAGLAAFLRIGFALLDQRPALLAAGLSPTLVTWLAWNVFLVAAIHAGLVILREVKGYSARRKPSDPLEGIAVQS